MQIAPRVNWKKRSHCSMCQAFSSRFHYYGRIDQVILSHSKRNITGKFTVAPPTSVLYRGHLLSKATEGRKRHQQAPD